MSWSVSRKLTVAAARGKFGNLEEWESLQLEAVTGRLVKTITEDTSMRVTAVCEMYYIRLVTQSSWIPITNPNLVYLIYRLINYTLCNSQ
jgi:hypothetical protein